MFDKYICDTKCLGFSSQMKTSTSMQTSSIEFRHGKDTQPNQMQRETEDRSNTFLYLFIGSTASKKDKASQNNNI
jgi:hypothetical protein